MYSIGFDKFLIKCAGDCTVSCSEFFSVGPKPMVTLSLSELPGNAGQMILALGGLDHKIHLYCGERTGKVCALNLGYLSFLLDGLSCHSLLSRWDSVAFTNLKFLWTVCTSL